MNSELDKLKGELASAIRCGRNLTGQFWFEYRKRCIDPIEERIKELENTP